MDNISTISKKAIEAFDNNDLSAFEEYSKAIFNHFNVYPSGLELEKNCYSVGIVYYYLEGALRDLDDAHRVCFENACYCFSQVIKSENVYERQCAAIRLFLLLHYNGSASFNLFYNILKENCQKIHEINFDTYLFRLNNDKSAIRGEVRQNVKKIKSYCYSIFVTQSNHSSVSANEMNMLNSIIMQDNYKETPSIMGYKFDGEYVFQEHFYNYLLSEIRMEKGLRASRMSRI
jgi:hypothetical protein